MSKTITISRPRHPDAADRDIMLDGKVVGYVLKYDAAYYARMGLALDKHRTFSAHFKHPHTGNDLTVYRPTLKSLRFFLANVFTA